MRYIKLTSSLFIGLVGFVLYFFTIPSIDTDNFLTIDVEAGDKEILDDMYLSGSLDYNSNYYSSFVYQDQETLIVEELPFLKQMDDPYDSEIRSLLKKYPEFISDIHYDMNQMVTHYGDSKDYVTAAYFNYERADYSIGLDELYLELFNKETKEIKKEKIKLTEYENGDSADIYAIHENYPTVQILYSTTEWDSDYYESTSTLLLGEYNLETKKYTQETLKKLEGDFSFNEVGMNVTNNQELAVLPFYSQGNEYVVDESSTGEVVEHMTSESDGRDKIIVVDLVNKTTNEVKYGLHYLVSEQNELYSFTEENGSGVLNKYDDNNEEVVDTISLDLEEIELDESTELDPMAKIIDGKLFLFYNIIQYENGESKLNPINFQAFAVDSGKEVAKGKIKFNGSKFSASNALIDNLEKN